MDLPKDVETLLEGIRTRGGVIDKVIATHTEMEAQINYNAVVAELCERLSRTTAMVGELIAELPDSYKHPETRDYCLENFDLVDRAAKMGEERSQAVLKKIDDLKMGMP